MTQTRRPAAGLVAVLAVVAVTAWLLTRAGGGGGAAPPPAAVTASAEVGASTLLATDAITDSLSSGIRMVRVRIVDSLSLTVRLSAPDRLVLAAPPAACLIGPDAAPDDAGLSSPCWGEPDLSAALAAALGRDGNARPILPGGAPTAATAQLTRGASRCDYPPGTWRLELGLVPADAAGAPAAGAPAAGTSATTPPGSPRPAIAVSTTFTVPWAPQDVLRPAVGGTRYCGLATRVLEEQGEPAVVGR